MAKLDIEAILRGETLTEDEKANLPVVVNPQLSHIPIMFLLDTSGSMNEIAGSSTETKIEQLSFYMHKLFDKIMYDGTQFYTKLRRQGVFCVLTYNETVNVLMPWTNGGDINALPPFEAEGTTRMHEAISTASNMLLDRLRSYIQKPTRSLCGMV